MKDANDTKTQEIFPLPKKRGRRPISNPKTPAERARAYRARLLETEGDPIIQLNLLVPRSTRHFLSSLSAFTGLSMSEMLQQLIEQKALDTMRDFTHEQRTAFLNNNVTNNA